MKSCEFQDAWRGQVGICKDCGFLWAVSEKPQCQDYLVAVQEELRLWSSLSDRHRHEGKWLESSRVTPLQRILASPPGLVPRPVLNYNLVGIFLLSSVLISCLASGISTLFITFLLRIFKDVLIRTCHSCWLVVATFEVTSKPFLCSWGQTLLFTLLLTDHLTDLGKNFESKRAHQD